ncbi:MAG: exonuclease SbcCD subunit D [Lachnospiraceae bacterium]|nr:exonuclease SbcCD subunit D [Lachnospiraceae bacterium]
MKFFHLSDLHIGLKLMNRELGEDQRHILQQIVDLAEAERPDAVVIAGDVYDKAVPSAEAVEIFDEFISQLAEALPECEILVISGNHDSAARMNLYRSVLQRQRIHMIGLPPRRPEEHIERVTLRDEYGEVHFYLLPFVRPSMVREIVGTDARGNSLSYDETLYRLIGREEIDENARNVLVSHQFYLPVGAEALAVERADSEIRTVGDIDEVRADILERFDYAALGHIHRPMRVGDDAHRYCGTPLACSVSEAGQEKGIVLVEMGRKGDVQTKVLPLVPLRQVRVLRGTAEEVLTCACEFYVTVILTDTTDLEILDVLDRLRAAFPNLLEVRREGIRGVEYGQEYAPEQEKDIYELCTDFLGELDDAEQAVLRDVINTVKEAR